MANISITSSNVVPSAAASRRTLTAAESINAGETVCKDADGDLILTDAADATKIAVEGIALNSAATGQPVTYAQVDANLELGTAVTNGGPLYLSETAGKLTATLADIVTVGATPVSVGLGDGTTEVVFDALNSRTGAAIV